MSAQSITRKSITVDFSSKIDRKSQVASQVRTTKNKLGYVPLVGTAVGLYRIFSAIVSLMCVAVKLRNNDIEKNRGWDKTTAFNVKQIKRGAKELLPVVGGILNYRKDSAKIESLFNKYLDV